MALIPHKQQDKDAFLDYSLDWSDWLAQANGDTISTSVWASDAALTLNSESVSGAFTTVWVQGGLPNKWYAITNTVETTQGRRDQRTIRLFITDDTATATAVDGTACFPNRIDAIDALRRDNLLLAGQSYLAGVDLSDDLIFEKLRSAESQVQHHVRCYLAPTVIIPDDAPQSEIDALELASTRYAQEAAYDYDADFFSGDKWGYIVAKQKPLISVQSIKFAYPTPIGQVFELPTAWIRADKKYAHIRIVPTALSASVPMASFIMQSISGGRSIPFMIQLRYTAGIRDVHAEYPELVSAIKRLAVLNILKDSFTPQSGSISADGLSQSMSADMDKYQDSVDKTIDSVRDAIHGIRFAVF
jgi:hypothetical protein